MPKQTVYIISSHWNAKTARLNRKEYPTMLDALHAIGSDIVDEGWSDAYMSETGYEIPCNAVGVYATEEDREANMDGGAPHRVLAVVREVRVPV